MAGPPDKFKRLLEWLHPDPEEAAREYERIRDRLIRKFRSHGCDCAAEQLADETMERVAETLTPEEFANWEGPKEKKFSRVGYFILLEYKKKQREVEWPEDLDPPNPNNDEEGDEDSELKWSCMDRCMEKLAPDERDLIVRYYQGSKAKKIKNREVLARDLDLTLPALRVKAHRIRKDLKRCIFECLADTKRRGETE